MGWVKIDDDFARHPKVVSAGPLGMAMQVAALCYCNKYPTDGFVPRSVVPGLLNLEGIGMRMWCGEVVGGGEDATWQLIVEDLLEADLWHEVKGGYQIHDYLDFQPSKEQVLAEREITKRRNAMNSNSQLSKEVQQRDGDICRYCGTQVNWRDRKSGQGGAYDHVIPISKGGQETVDNIVVCCRTCNLSKGARTLEEAGMSPLPPKTKTESKRNQDGIKTETRQPVPKKEEKAPGGAGECDPAPAENCEEQGAQHEEGRDEAPDEGQPGRRAGSEPGSTGKGEEYTPDFKRYYAVYPRKREKRKAFRAWQMLLKARDRPPKPTELIRAAENYARAREGKDPSFTKLPATFLSLKDRPYLDYLDGIPPEEATRTSPRDKPKEDKYEDLYLS